MGILSLKLNVSWGTASGVVASVNIWSGGLATIAPRICGCLNLNCIMQRMLYVNTWPPCEYVEPSARSLALFWHGGVLASAASQLSNCKSLCELIELYYLILLSITLSKQSHYHRAFGITRCQGLALQHWARAAVGEASPGGSSQKGGSCW